MVALVDTGATMSCCRWEWYQQWKDHLGDVIKSKVRIMGVGPDPIKIKGLTKPLTLHWDGVGGKFQLMILTALTDMDVVLGMDVLSQFDVKINFKKQVACPAREPCTPLEPAKTVGLLLDNPGFTFNPLPGRIVYTRFCPNCFLQSVTSKLTKNRPFNPRGKRLYSSFLLKPEGVWE